MKNIIIEKTTLSNVAKTTPDIFLEVKKELKKEGVKSSGKLERKQIKDYIQYLKDQKTSL